ncbi:MAG: hypothetical protein A2Y76_07125 [Planctomycetes bacterium RBG_13_60_9]|nr:MAG: hypothetical protein A2Y76_07125 [Planctomycetes bacterium RBG_13_60_9]
MSVVTKEARYEAKDDLKHALSSADGSKSFALTETARPEVKRRIAEIARGVESSLRSIDDVTQVQVEEDHREDSTRPEMFRDIEYTLIATTLNKTGVRLVIRWNWSKPMLIQIDSRRYSRTNTLFRRHPRITIGAGVAAFFGIGLITRLLGLGWMDFSDYTLIEILIIMAISYTMIEILIYGTINLAEWLFAGRTLRRRNKTLIVQAHNAAVRTIENILGNAVGGY